MFLCGRVARNGGHRTRFHPGRRREPDFFHRNASHTVVDAVIKQQGLESEASHLYNPLRNLIFGGRIAGDLIFSGTRRGHYCGTEYEAWTYKSRKPANRQSFRITLHAVQTPVVSDWEAGLEKTEKELHAAKDKEASRRWWNEFWQRSFVRAEGEAAHAARNYDLYRYMAACNAFGQWSAKPDGGCLRSILRQWEVNRNSHPTTEGEGRVR